MKHPWTLREQFELIDRIAINRMTFEAHFTKTKERIEFSFNGWDGKSYNGETRHAYVYRTDIPGYEDAPLHQSRQGSPLRRGSRECSGKGHRPYPQGCWLAGGRPSCQSLNRKEDCIIF